MKCTAFMSRQPSLAGHLAACAAGISGPITIVHSGAQPSIPGRSQRTGAVRVTSQAY
jgi:hypothetical protein